MKLLVTTAHPCLLEHPSPSLGRLVQPRHYSSIEATAAAGIPWAADNDAFNGWGDIPAQRFLTMLERLAGLPGCRFVVAPDVVGDAGLTDLLFEEFAPVILSHGLPVAYVLQENGCEYEPRGVPWGSIAALFIGCALDEYKLGPEVAAIVREAKARDKWVHMGRVNSVRRMRYAEAIGCDSVDGSMWARWRKTYLDAGLAALDQPQLSLLGASA